MRRGPKPAKSKEAKPPAARKSPKNDGARVSDLEKRLAEAQEQQTATAGILRVIASSPTDLQPVLDALAERAARLCNAYDAVILRLEGGVLRRAAHYGPIPPVGVGITATRSRVSGRAVVERQPVHVADAQAESEEFPEIRTLARDQGFRTILSVPLLREGVAIGVIALRRAEVQPFTEKQIDLLKTFADQAVIAIENVRLFTELQQKNQALSESLERQTATSDILRVISQSPTDVEPVFRTILEAAARLANTDVASVWLHEGDGLLRCIHAIASRNIEWMIGTLVRAEESIYGSASSRRGRPAQVADIRTTKPYEAGDPLYRRTGDEMGVRTSLSVPFVADGRLLGGFIVNRLEVRAFADEDIALLQAFADQAVIAIENVRLFTELQEKNQALTQAHAQVTEALEQQTATGDILRVISSSPTDIQPVFDAIVQSAVRLCGAMYGTVSRFDGTLIQSVAHYNLTPEQIEQSLRTFPRPLSDPGGTATAIRTASVVRVADLDAEDELAGAAALERCCEPVVFGAS